MTVQLKGYGSTATFDPETAVLTIERDRTHKQGRGHTTVKASAVTGVTIDEPTRMHPVGFMQFMADGLTGKPAKSRRAAQKQPNAIVFHRKHIDDARRLAAAVQSG